MNKGVMRRGEVTLVQWEYLKFFSLKRCSKGGKQQSKTNPDNPKTGPPDTIKIFNKEKAEEYPKERHIAMNSVAGEEKASAFNGC